MSALPDSLVPLGSYAPPRADTPSRMRMALRRMRDRLALGGTQGTLAKSAQAQGTQAKGALLPDGLARPATALFDRDPWARLRTHIFALLDDAYGDWIASDQGPRVCACVALASAPPGLFRDWARTRGHPVSARPGAGGVVIPQMDGLITRSGAGLDRLRTFATALELAEGKHLICGTTTQWRWLTRVSALDLVVGDVQQLPAFGADAIAALIRDGTSAGPLISRASGGDILARGDDGALCDGYLRALAAQAFGCPWAALELLDSAVTHAPQGADPSATWVGPADLPAVPAAYPREARFLLHSLMIHGSLTPETAAASMPMPCPPGLIRALARSGLIQGKDTLRLVPCYTPHIRRTLTEAGFPLDRL